MGAYKSLDGDPPSWAEQIYVELCELRAMYEEMRADRSLTVDTNEAAKLLGVTPQTIRKRQAVGKMPRLVSGKGENFLWSRKAIEQLAEGRAKGGRPRVVK